MDQINLSEDKDTWQAIVKAILNLPGLLNVGNFLTRWGVSIFHHLKASSETVTAK